MADRSPFVESMNPACWILGAMVLGGVTMASGAGASAMLFGLGPGGLRASLPGVWAFDGSMALAMVMAFVGPLVCGVADTDFTRRWCALPAMGASTFAVTAFGASAAGITDLLLVLGGGTVAAGLVVWRQHGRLMQHQSATFARPREIAARDDADAADRSTDRSA